MNLLKKLLELRAIADDCLAGLDDAGYENLAKRLEVILPELRLIFHQVDRYVSGDE